jgi:hypothetical protein
MEATARLNALGVEPGRVALQQIASEARRMGAQPVYALIPMPRTKGVAPVVSIAAEAGLLTVDLRGVYEGHDIRTLTVSDTDFHPNTEGHRIIAERLYEELVNMPLSILAPEGSVSAEDQARLEIEWNRKQVAGQDLDGKIPGGRAVKAGQFKGIDKSTPWAVRANNGAMATMESLPDGGMRVTITALPQKVGWHVKLRQAPLALTEDRDYRVTFRARAGARRPMSVGAEREVRPFGLLGFYESFDVTTQWQTWEWTFTATATEPLSRLFFDLGESQVPAEIADIVIVDVATGRPVTVRPASPGR